MAGGSWAMTVITDKKRAASLIVFAVAAGVIQLAAFAINRETGDLIYLVAGIGLAVGTAWVSSSTGNRLLALAIGLLVSAALLILHTFWTGFLRDDVFGLTEDFGQSAMLGFDMVLILSLTVLSGLLSAILVRKKPEPERYWPAKDPDA